MEYYIYNLSRIDIARIRVYLFSVLGGYNDYEARRCQNATKGDPTASS